MTARISIIDYDMGNLRSVQKAIEHIGGTAVICRHPEDILAADKLILPGVGAFRDAMAALRERQLVEPLREVVARGTPLFGICLGLQMLFETSFENGQYDGLGLLAGDVVRFPETPGLEVPHMGWNQLDFVRESPYFGRLPADPYFYFVHSYYVRPTDPQVTVATSDHGQPFTAAVECRNIFATQFHPEKSQACGLQLLRHFATL